MKTGRNTTFTIFAFLAAFAAVFSASCELPADLDELLQQDYITVSFDKNDDNAAGKIPSKKVPPFSLLVLPDGTGLKNEGKVLDYWYTKTSEGGVGKSYQSGKAIFPTSDITFYAQWKDEDGITTYTVTFNSNGGSAVPAQTVESGEKITEPPPPTKPTFTFGGWYKDNNAFAEPWNFATDTVTAALTLYAKWNSGGGTTYTVTFDSNNGSAVAPKTVESGGKVTEPTPPTKAGSTFGGWYKDNNAFADPWNFATDTVTENTTLYAKWNSGGGITEYTVTFAANGGSGTPPAAQTVTIIPSSPGAGGLTRSGYTFAGWATGTNGTGTVNFPYEPLSNITLYANWTYTVTFHINGGTGTTPDSETRSAGGGSITLPGGDGLTNAGFTFGGWNTSPTGGGTDYTAGTSETFDGDTTLYAKWDAVVITYNVTFNSNGGSAVQPQNNVASGGKVIEPAQPTLSGNTFGGWFEDDGTFLNPWDFENDTVTAALTLYAKWIQTYTVTFNSNGGSAVQSQNNVASGGNVSEPEPPTKAGHTFDGWYKEPAFINLWIFTTDTVSDNTTLYAKWNPNTYTVDYNSNGGTGSVGSQSFTYGTWLALQNNTFTRSGYSPNGWATSSGGEREYSNGQSVDNLTPPAVGDTITLYAAWIPNYPVAFEANGGTPEPPSPLDIDHGDYIIEPASMTKTGFTFGGWYTDSALTQEYDFESPVTGPLTLYAKWDAE